MRLILASASPQRQRLLEEAGYRFETLPSDADELESGLEPAQLAVHNASLKARSVAEGLQHAVVVGSDTVVALDGNPFGKPANERHAAAMLSALAGREHMVHSAIAVVTCDGDGIKTEVSGVATTVVRFSPLSACQIDAHLALGEWRGRAGGYAIQESGHEIVESIEGDLDTVIGIPMALLAEMLPVAVQP